jgi:hypothetical protein
VNEADRDSVITLPDGKEAIDMLFTPRITRLVSLALLSWAIGVIGSRPASAAGLTLTPAGVAQGLSLTTFASGFPNSGGEGPLGIAFPSTGGVLVTDNPGNIRLFPTDTDGQNAASVPVTHNYGSVNAVGLAQVGGAIYMTQYAAGAVVQINNDGTFNQTIVTGFSNVDGIAASPLTGHLFISASGNGIIYDVNPGAKTATPFENVVSDGLSVSPDGTTLYAAIVAGALSGHIIGYNIATKAQVYDSGPIPGGIDGTAAGTGSFAGFIFANTNSGTVYEVTLGSNPVATLIASGGSRGDFVSVDPSTNTLLLTQTDSIVRLHGASFVTPEPSSIALLGTGLAGLVAVVYRQRRRSTLPG